MLNKLYSILYKATPEQDASVQSYYDKAHKDVILDSKSKELLNLILPSKSFVKEAYSITNDADYVKLMRCYIAVLVAYTMHTCAGNDIMELDPANTYWEPNSRGTEAKPLQKIFNFVNANINGSYSMLDSDLLEAIKLGRSLLDKIGIVFIQLLRLHNGV